MSATIDKINDAEKAVNALVRKQTAMEREFKQDDGEIDKSERAQLDGISRKIAEDRSKLATLRKELELARRGWEKRDSEGDEFSDQLGKLLRWDEKSVADLAQAKVEIFDLAQAQKYR
jgi:chromosome segregation ATPase